MIRQCDSWPLLETADAVIDGVGGTFAAAKISGRPAQQVSNWRRTGTLAPGTFLNFQRALAERQLRARPSLWRIDEPANGDAPDPRPHVASALIRPRFAPDGDEGVL